MSLEDKLAANTAALEANTAALNAVAAAWNTLAAQATAIKAGADAGSITKVAAAGVALAEVKPEKAVRAKKAEKPADTEVFEPTTPPAAEPAPAVSENDTKVTYADVSSKVLNLLKTDKPKVMATLAKFNVPNAKTLPESQWAAFLAELDADESLV